MRWIWTISLVVLRPINTQTGDSVGASLGGESFLAQFANVSDIMNDMSWEDIIPLDE